MKISIPYGKSTLSCAVPDARLKGVLTSKAHAFKAEAPEAEDALIAGVGRLIPDAFRAGAARPERTAP